MTSAPITPGTQPQRVSKKTIKNEPQPLSITAKGGKKIANNTRNTDIIRNSLFLNSNICYCALAAGEDTLCTAEWQWGIEDRIANLMTPKHLTCLSIHT